MFRFFGMLFRWANFFEILTLFKYAIGLRIFLTAVTFSECYPVENIFMNYLIFPLWYLNVNLFFCFACFGMLSNCEYLLESSQFFGWKLFYDPTFLVCYPNVNVFSALTSFDVLGNLFFYASTFLVLYPCEYVKCSDFFNMI